MTRTGPFVGCFESSLADREETGAGVRRIGIRPLAFMETRLGDDRITADLDQPDWYSSFSGPCACCVTLYAFGKTSVEDGCSPAVDHKSRAFEERAIHPFGLIRSIDPFVGSGCGARRGGESCQRFSDTI